jgi:hypothetical protein
VAYAIFDTPAIHGIPGIKELAHVVGLGSPDAPLAFGERLQVCLLAADQTGWSAQMG